MVLRATPNVVVGMQGQVHGACNSISTPLLGVKRCVSIDFLMQFDRIARGEARVVLTLFLEKPTESR